MEWNSLLRPAEAAESQLIDAILEGRFPINSSLPAERELAAQLGVTRPTLREALQRLARDGWIEIRQGKPTRVRDYWHEGSLGVLGAIARHSQQAPTEFISDLLGVRLAMAPAYTRLAIENSPEPVIEQMQRFSQLDDSPEAFAQFDWDLHSRLTRASGNPIFTLILNGFCDLYYPLACIYFKLPHSRVNSRAFYGDLLTAAQDRDGKAAESITRQVMHDSIALWQAALYQK